MTQKSGDELAGELARGGEPETLGAIAFDLLGAIFKGYDDGNLVPLLRSDIPEVVDAASWILSELGPSGAALLQEAVRLLESPNRKTRIWAIDSVNSVATLDDGHAVAKALMLVNDDDGGVRWRALDMAAKLSNECLVAALPSISDAAIASNTEWMMSGHTSAEVLAHLNSSDRIVRTLGAAAAARLRSRDLAPLEHAVNSDDETVASYARYALDIAKNLP